jgi:hypothetical protein
LIEHGEYVVGRCDQVILLRARGPWNDETLKRGSHEFSLHSQKLTEGKPWAQLSCLYGESIMPPWTFKHFVYHTKIRKDQGLSALAVVILDSDIEATIKQQLSQAYSEVEISHSFFNNVDASIKWLNQQGFELEHKVAMDFINQ